MSDNNELTLESLLQDLEDNGGVEKQASEENTEQETQEEVSSEEQGTSASDQLQDLLTKKASASEESTNEEDKDMNKQAAENQGRQIADAILGVLTKQADEGSNNTTRETAQMVNEQNVTTEQTPVEGRSVTETLKGIVQRGNQTGAVHPDKLALNSTDEKDEASGGPALTSSDEHPVEELPQSDLSKTAEEDMSEQDDNMQKLAAVGELMDLGYEFEDASDIVKEAAAELEEEESEGEYEHTKLATVNSLMEEGMNFDDAYNLASQAMDQLEKEAGSKTTAVKGAYKGAKGRIADAMGKGGVGGAVQSGYRTARAKAREGAAIAGGNMKTYPGRYAAGAGAAGAAGAAGGAAAASKKDKDQEKKAAAFDLINAGYSVEEAVDILNG